MIYLTADTINGVQISEPFEDDYSVLGDMDFYNALPDLHDGEVISGVVIEEVYQRIQSEYGIHA